MRYTPSDAELKQINTNFVYHPVKDDQQERYVLLREQARTLALTMLHNVPVSRERSIALRHLENAVMWANAAIARNE